MKVVINRKKYDTDTAECVACYSHAWPGDYNYVSEALYRKKTGEYFLHGDGGANSKYMREEGNTYYGGERIIPLDEEEAKDWTEEYAPEDYEDIFGEVEE